MTDTPLTAAILAGGLATRLRPIAATIPKAMLDVNGEPFLVHQLRLLRANGVGRVVLCVGHLGEQIAETIGDRAFGIEVTYAFDGPTLLGTAGALRRALPQLPDQFLVLYGDSYLRFDYQAAWRAFRASNKRGLMTVFHNQGDWDHSNVIFDGQRILAYDKINRTPTMRYIDYGLGILDRDAFASVPEGKPYDLATLYQELLAGDELAAYEVFERYYEIGSPAGLEELRTLLADPATTGGQP